jgi:CRISPR-associated protein Csm4
MSTWKLVHLNFGRNVAHFGELGIGLEEANERVRSDTLFSAWMSAYARLFSKAEIESLIEQMQQSVPPFRISSTFIYQVFGDRTVYYLPKPLKLPPGYPNGDDFEFAKTFKKLRYLPASVWQRWYQNSGFDRDTDGHELIQATQGNASGALAEAGTFAYGQAYKIQKHPKVSIDRTTRATNFYHTGVVGYRWEAEENKVKSLSGLYFLVEFPREDQDFEQTFFAVLNFLGGEGLGGERSSGAGQFKQETSEPDPVWTKLSQFGDSHQYCLLSLCWEPKISQSLLSQASYELQERGGWITAPGVDAQRRRRTVQMFTEGSVFSGSPAGQLADVTPVNRRGDRTFTQHHIYRSGIALSLPIRAPDPL